MSGCGAVVGGVSLENVDITNQAVIQGIVSKDGIPASVGYVRLHDKSDEFVAEVPISTQGEFRFFTVSGDWNVVTLIPGGNARHVAQAELGKITELAISIS